MHVFVLSRIDDDDDVCHKYGQNCDFNEGLPQSIHRVCGGYMVMDFSVIHIHISPINNIFLRNNEL